MSLEVRGLCGCFPPLQKINTFHVMLWIFILSTSRKLSRARHLVSAWAGDIKENKIHSRRGREIFVTWLFREKHSSV